MNFKVKKPKGGSVKGAIRLDGSKSISNRALIIRSLSGHDFNLEGLSTAKDTETLDRLLTTSSNVLDVGPAGTTFRFLTAYLALQEGTQELTGSARMQERPIGALVDALNGLGASIRYKHKEGYPPLMIGSPGEIAVGATVRMPATISSQFISAMLMIGPTLPGGLQIELEGDLVSPSYLNMTIEIMKHFGASVEFEGSQIKIAPTGYSPADFVVEADWSAASYHYALAALAEDVDLRLSGLFADSWQGDSVCMSLFEQLGVVSSWDGKVLRLQQNQQRKRTFKHHYLDCPDIAQTMAVVSAGLGIPAVFTGLETLRIKETDRILALKQELAKTNVFFYPLPPKLSGSDQETFVTEGKSSWEKTPSFATYHDHRMAMAFAPLALLDDVIVEDVRVVDKSYPDFWKDLLSLGFSVEMV
ncbi:MAG: 3-phosphoshikimate 1-carboxyvinyltransferase [Saprospiraceae bacterium]|nr:3-phosphoshikimate 1-carboxyvinyltransferase [Saprospiraceae bacterium]